MKNLMTALSGILRDNVMTTLSKLCDAVKIVFEYLNRVRTEKAETDAENSVHEACRNGDMGSLLDSVSKLRKVKPNAFSTIIALTLMLVGGCTTIEVCTTEQWEGRYSDPCKAADALCRAKLSKNESVWLLSSRTLERVLTTDKE